MTNLTLAQANAAFKKADEAHRISFEAHDAIRDGYRAGTVCDLMFLASADAHKAALQKWEQAEADVIAAIEAQPVAIQADTQFTDPQGWLDV